MLDRELRKAIPDPTPDEREAILFYTSAYIEQHLKQGDFSSIEGAGQLIKYVGVEKFQFSGAFVEKLRFWTHAIGYFTLIGLTPGMRYADEEDRVTFRKTGRRQVTLNYPVSITLVADTYGELKKKIDQTIKEKTLEKLRELPAFKNRTPTMDDVDEIFKVRELVLAILSQDSNPTTEIDFKGLRELIYSRPPQLPSPE